MKRRINIEVLSDDIPLEVALVAVSKVVESGRIFKNGECFCYATTFTDGMVVYATANKLDAGSKRASSDSFQVDMVTRKAGE